MTPAREIIEGERVVHVRTLGRKIAVLAVVVACGAALSASIATASAPPAAPASPAPLRIALVVLDSPDGTGDVAAWNHFLFGNVSGGNGYRWAIERMAGGAVTVEARVFGPAFSGLGNECSPSRWRDAASTVIAAAGSDPAAFDHIVAFVGAPRQCGFRSVAEQNGKGIFLNGEAEIRAIVMGIGVNRGLRVSGLSWCRGAPRLDCPVKGSDALDVMWQNPFTSKELVGYAWPGYMSAVHKRALGWLPPSMVTTVSGGTRTIDLTTNDAMLSDGGTRLIVIPRGDGTSIVIDRGHYRFADGVYVRLWCPNGCPHGRAYDTALLYVDRERGYPNLPAGQTFTDAVTSVSITTVDDPVNSAVGRVRVSVPAHDGVYVSAARGEIMVRGTDGADDVRVTTVKGERVVDAHGATISAGPGCRADGATVRCRGGRLTATLGAGADALTVIGRLRAIVDGGPGDDRFTTGRAGDVFIGGDGTDTVDYRGRNTAQKAGGPVVVRVGEGPKSGQQGEKDDIRADVERVLVP